MSTNRVWAEISLGNIVHNFNEARRFSEDTRIMAVVKADAYGHGAIAVAHELEKAGAYAFGVAAPEEALELREAGITRPVLVLGGVAADNIPRLAALGISVTVASAEAAAQAAKAAAAAGYTLGVHIKLDTGMSRLGIFSGDCEKAAKEASDIFGMEALRVEGVFSHFATADYPEDPFIRVQLDRFVRTTACIESAGHKIPLRHMANSAGVLSLPEARFDMVRPGIMLYGLYPSEELAGCADLRPAMTLRTQIIQIHDYNEPVTVGYGRIYATDKPARIATISIGYADGLSRTLSGKFELLICGKKVPQVGRISMDMITADVTDCPEAKPGTPVTIFGSDGRLSISVDTLAAKQNTINYELISVLTRRVKKIYTP